MPDVKVAAEVAARVWKIEVTVGSEVAEGDVLMILESMKMEIPIEAPRAGTVAKILVQEDAMVEEDQPVVILST